MKSFRTLLSLRSLWVSSTLVSSVYVNVQALYGSELTSSAPFFELIEGARGFGNRRSGEKVTAVRSLLMPISTEPTTNGWIALSTDASFLRSLFTPLIPHHAPTWLRVSYGEKRGGPCQAASIKHRDKPIQPARGSTNGLIFFSNGRSIRNHSPGISEFSPGPLQALYAVLHPITPRRAQEGKKKKKRKEK